MAGRWVRMAASRRIVRSALTKAWMQQGDTLEKMVKPIVDGLDAKLRVKTLAGISKRGDREPLDAVDALRVVLTSCDSQRYSQSLCHSSYAPLFNGLWTPGDRAVRLQLTSTIWSEIMDCIAIACTICLRFDGLGFVLL